MCIRDRTEGEIKLKGELITKPGPDRIMVFQEFDQLLPWKTVFENVMFPLKTTGRLHGKAAVSYTHLSHDFRTPLSSILGSATSLIGYGDKLDAAAKTDLLAQIKQEAESLDEMVRNLLSITRIDSGALELRQDWIDLREIVDRVASAARRRGTKQHIEIALPPDLPMVKADATLVEQVIGNVIGNAAVHTPATTRVVVDALVRPHEIALTVTDDGPGIPPQALPQIFDKFVKADATQGDGGQGSGLGLAIAKGIMEAHGGSIAAESPYLHGHGTRIVLSLSLIHI